MNSKVIVIALSLVAVIAAAAVVFSVREPLPNQSATTIPSNYFDQSAATEDRIFALEAAVAAERNARLLLEEELQALYYELDELRSGPDEATEERDAAAELQREAMRERADRFRAGNTTQGRTDMLIEAGFAPDRAEWIVQRESELQMDSMQAMFDARQSGERELAHREPMLGQRQRGGALVRMVAATHHQLCIFPHRRLHQGRDARYYFTVRSKTRRPVDSEVF